MVDSKEALRRLADAAERFVNKAPNQKRTEMERTALLDAIMHAQLLLSIAPARRKERTPSPSPPKQPKRRPLRLAK
ncbi:MAG TPA: hypothetical protein VFG71_09100 [Nitrospiraceae bacterium]|nr:hypothetical protein [Nitrospiraceae bacterium]